MSLFSHQFRHRSGINYLTNLQRTIRLFASSVPCSSHIGRAPLVYPQEVVLTHNEKPIRHPRVPIDFGCTTLTIKGPLGEHSLPIRPFIRLSFSKPERDDSNEKNKEEKSEGGSTTLTLSIKDETESVQREMWGLTRALIARYIEGVLEGHRVQIKLVGVGYRAALEEDGKKLAMKLGFSHPVEMYVPKGIKCKVVNPQSLLLEGSDWQKVKEFAARIRRYRPPEPYNQKGIFVGDETIKKKEGKKK